MSAYLFDLASRGVVSVRGDDRQRWLDGMLSCDVKKLAPGGGAHGLLLTPQGRIVGEMHVLHRGDAFWLETEASAIASTIARLEGFVIADDVVLADVTPQWARLALEGPGALAVLAACGSEAPLQPHAVASTRIAGAEVVAARYGFTHPEALQLFVPRAREPVVTAALCAAGAARANHAELELRRIEAGTPWLGKELDESVLPAEARLDGIAVAVDKGCYTGQEVVARMRSRGRQAHALVGLRFAGDGLPEPRSSLASERGAAGSVTSAVRSPRFGAIGLGFVQAPLAVPGTQLRVDGRAAVVVALPFTTEAAQGHPSVTGPTGA